MKKKIKKFHYLKNRISFFAEVYKISKTVFCQKIKLVFDGDDFLTGSFVSIFGLESAQHQMANGQRCHLKFPFLDTIME